MKAENDPAAHRAAAAGVWAGRRSTSRNGRTGNLKRAEIIAGQIEEDIISRGWPVGAVLGSEPELAEKYNVSRAVFREAVRLLEHHYIAEMRRGRKGGLFVIAPDPGALADALALYLQYHHVDPADLFEARQAIELTSARLAAERATEEDIARLRELAAAPIDTSSHELAERSAEFHTAVAGLSGNPAIHLFVNVLTMLTETTLDHTPATPMAGQVHHAHAAIAGAIAAADGALAQHRMLRHFEAMAAVDSLAARTRPSAGGADAWQ